MFLLPGISLAKKLTPSKIPMTKPMIKPINSSSSNIWPLFLQKKRNALREESKINRLISHVIISSYF